MLAIPTDYFSVQALGPQRRKKGASPMFCLPKDPVSSLRPLYPSPPYSTQQPFP